VTGSQVSRADPGREASYGRACLVDRRQFNTHGLVHEARVDLALTVGLPPQSLEEPHIRELDMSAHQVTSKHCRGRNCATDERGAQAARSVGREHREAVTLPDAVGWVEREQPDRARRRRRNTP
jgi:hypothetical protein